MNFKEAIEELKKGKKIRRKMWKDDIFIFIEDENIKSFFRENRPFHYDIDIITSDTWVIHDDKEEKQFEFTEAIDLLLQNKSIRLIGWPQTTYIKMENDRKDFYISRMEQFSYVPTFQDFISIDWEILDA